jgi:hypothetical protein
VHFGFVPPPYDDLTWSAVFGLLDTAVRRGGNDWIEVSDDLATGRAQLWLGTVGDRPEIAAVSRLDGDTFEVWLAGGPIVPKWLPHLETAVEASKEAGTTNGRIIGRKGWERVLRPLGWRRDGDDLVKEWTNEEKDRPEE